MGGGGGAKRHQGALPSGTHWGDLRLAKVLGVQVGERDEDEQLCTASGSGMELPKSPRARRVAVTEQRLGKTPWPTPRGSKEPPPTRRRETSKTHRAASKHPEQPGLHTRPGALRGTKLEVGAGTAWFPAVCSSLVRSARNKVPFPRCSRFA